MFSSQYSFSSWKKCEFSEKFIKTFPQICQISKLFRDDYHNLMKNIHPWLILLGIVPYFLENAKVHIFMCWHGQMCWEQAKKFQFMTSKKPSLSVPLGREILVPLELVVSRHYNPIINYKVGRSTMRTIVVVVLGSRDDGRHIYVYFPKNVQEWGHWKKPNWLRCIYGAGSRDWMLLHGVLFIYLYMILTEH